MKEILAGAQSGQIKGILCICFMANGTLAVQVGGEQALVVRLGALQSLRRCHKDYRDLAPGRSPARSGKLGPRRERMTKKDAKKLRHGLYRIVWKSGGLSEAAIGSLHNGDRWFAPTNWTASGTSGIASTNWKLVSYVEHAD